MEQSGRRAVPLDEIDTDQSDSVQKKVRFMGVDLLYILPKQQVRVSNGSITSELTESPNNDYHLEIEQSVKSPESVNQAKNILAVPAYVEGDDGTITLGFILDSKSKHMNLLDENLLEELDLYAEKLLTIIDGELEFNKLISNKLLLPTVNSPFRNYDTSSHKIENSVKSSFLGGTESFNTGETHVLYTDNPLKREHGADSSFEVLKSAKPIERNPQGTLKENILRKFKHGHSRRSKDCKELKVSAKWTLYKQEQRSKMKNPTFTMNGVATVEGQEVKTTVNFYLDDDVLLNLMKICHSSK